MAHIISTKISQLRIARWFATAVPIDNTTWTETRQAIIFGGQTYLLSKDQVFQCGCGRYDPEWIVTEVIEHFRTVHGISPVKIEVECSYKP